MAFSDRLQLKIRGQRQPNDSNSLAEALTNSIWGKSPTTASKQAHSFLRYWDSHCSLIDGEDAIVKTHQDILDIIAFVRDNRLLTLDTLRQELIKVQPKWLGKTDDAAERAIEIAVRLWLFVEIDDWDDSMTLAEFIEESFRRSASTTEGVVLPDSFNARNIEKIGGFHILLTDCLAEHLHLDAVDKQLSIFHQSSFLSHYQNSGYREIYPPGLLEETTQTIALLFPPTDIASKRWIRRARHKADLDIEMGSIEPSTRDVQQFSYWRDRILLLRDSYDNAEPRDVKTWWYDKRNRFQRSTVLFAVIALILTVLFGLIQSVTGIMQVYVAFRTNP